MPEQSFEIEDELLLQAYLDEELTPEEAIRFEARLAAEPRLQAALSRWQSLYGALSAIDPVPLLEENLAPSVLERLDPSASVPRVWSRLTLFQLLLGTAVLLMTWPLWRLSIGWMVDRSALFNPLWVRLVLYAQGLAAVDLGQLLAGWVAAWSDLWQLSAVNIPFSTQYLIPMAVVAVLIWLVSTRLLWAADESILHGMPGNGDGR